MSKAKAVVALVGLMMSTPEVNIDTLAAVAKDMREKERREQREQIRLLRKSMFKRR